MRCSANKAETAGNGFERHAVKRDYSVLMQVRTVFTLKNGCAYFEETTGNDISNTAHILCIVLSVNSLALEIMNICQKSE